MKHTNRKEFCMNFKKYNEMELAMLASIATMTEYTAHRIARENGDLTPVVDEDCISAPEFSYLKKPSSSHHTLRRKATFKKKVEKKTLAQSLGYDLSTEDNSKKVRDLLSASHTDRKYFRGEKVEQKNWTVREEVSLMEQEQEELYYESVEKARLDMINDHDCMLSSIGEDIIDLKMDLKCNDYIISKVEKELGELTAAMEEATQKLQNAIQRKNCINAAILKKKEDYKRLDEELEQERIRRFGW